MIYVLGSLNMDLVFNLPKMPKAGETLKADSFNTYCGGKGANQAVAIAKLGSAVSMIGAVGNDTYGQVMIDNLQSFFIGTKHIRTYDCSSGQAVILIEKGQNRIILDGGANMRLTVEDAENGLAEAKKGDILVAQLEVPLEVVHHALKLARSKGMITVLNPAPAVRLTSEILGLVDIISPNETETEILTDVYPHDIVHTALAVKKLYSSGVKNVIITLGANGSAVSHGQNITEIPALKVKAVDTTAAGDTFIGAVCNRLENGFDIVEACRFATCASSITVQRKGAAISIPTVSEVEVVYKNMPKDTQNA